MNNRDSIRQLNTREQCRLKLAIFYGSKDNYQHGFKETLANATDEILNNFDSGVINVYLHDDLETITVEDSGRGVPINIKTGDINNYELLFEKLFAGTNFDNNENQKITTGLNGSGLCVLNHTSELFKVNVARDGFEYELLYENGGEFKYFKTLGKSDKHYSKFTFKLDKEVYTDTKYTYEEIKEICKHVSVPSNRIVVNLHYLNDIEVFHYDSLEEYIITEVRDNTSKVIVGETKEYNDKGEFNSIQVVLTSSNEVFQESYLNSNYLPEGGSINDGIIDGVKIFVNRYCKDNNLLDKKIKSISGKDVEDSISFVSIVLSTNVEYENQTKFKTSKKLYETIAKKYIQEVLEIYSIENPKDFKEFVNHILQVQKFNQSSLDNKEKLKKALSKNKKGLSPKIEGLKDCNMRKSEFKDRILLVCEGLSAASTIIDAFDGNTMGCYGLKGRFINSLKGSVSDVLANEPAIGIINALGCGIEIPKNEKKKFKDFNSFNNEDSRYNYVGILCDADAFGKGIGLSLLTFFYKFMPTLIKEGRVCMVASPRYEIYLKNGETIYVYLESEKDKKIKEIGEKNISHIGIVKGLGEMNKDEFWEYVLSPEAREKTFTSVKYNNDFEELIKETFDKLMGDNIEGRKEFIRENITNINLSEVE
ncbi:toprim domain-containing protein (plasmid) [Clostridium perfringens]|uniref:toprim domain-containing protein n=1 Tax=Clostridium perfringens TaxID=1502 RepID=UPI003748B0CB